MATLTIRSSPSGPLVEVLTPPDANPPDPAKFLNEAGDYVVPAGSGAVDSVQGSDGITPTTAQTGVVVLSGAALLPLDGSRPMTGDLDMGGNDIINVGSVGGVTLQTGGSATTFLNAQGNYVSVSVSVDSDDVANVSGVAGATVSDALDNLAAAIPPAAPVDSVQGSDGITPSTAQTGVVVLSGAALLPLDGSRPMTGDLDMGGNDILNVGNSQNIATQAGKENYSASLITGGAQIWGGTSGGSGDLYCSIVIPNGTTIPITDMVCAVTQTTVAAGGLSMAIFDGAGVRLAYTNIVNPVVGFQVVPLAVGSGLQLMAGSQYFFGLYSNRNGDQFGNYLGAGGLPSGLRLGFTVPNSGAIGGALQGIPADVSPYIGNLTQNRFYQLALG